MSLFIGKKFKIISKGTVSHAEILDIEDKFAIVLIDGKKFKMDKEKLISKFSDYELRKKSESKNHCKNCMEYKNGNCFGQSQICDDFRLAPEISKEEINNWPKNGSVSKSKSNKFLIREYNNIY
jgi:hypothetical protein